MKTKITILGVDISQITKKEAVKTVEGWLSSPRVRSHFIATPNPEMLVLAQKDKEFCHILNSADLAIPDGIGLLWAEKFLSLVYGIRYMVYGTKEKAVSRKPYTVHLSERVSGTDLMLDLCQLASQKGYTIGLLGAGEGVAKKTAEVLKKQFPGIKIKFALQEIPPSRSPFGHLEGVLSCDFLFVAFGAPKQEIFLSNQTKENSKINFRVGMGVGGAFDLISGKIKRAPKLMRDLGLEWLWRLVQEPKRIKRIWTATVVFPLLVLKESFKEGKISKK